MDVCKYCKKTRIYTNITRFFLLIKHIKYFVCALIHVFFKERLLLNVIVILIFLLLHNYCKINHLNLDLDLVYGSLLAIIITANLEKGANSYKENILWDGDWEIWKWQLRNFEHKRGVYISLCTELSNIINMISSDLNVENFGNVFSFKNFEKIVTQKWGYNIPINIQPDFNRLDINTAYDRFVHYCNSFKNIENTILSIQTLLAHINVYCPDFNVKSTVAILLQELYNTKRYVFDLNQFIIESSVNDDAIKWEIRLRSLQYNHGINTGTLDNNVNNIVACLYVVYEAINEDYKFSD